MIAKPPKMSLQELRGEVLGAGFRFRTPFGERLMVYADYTASGRNLRCIEKRLLEIQESYANTHTEDDVTGRSTSMLLARAEEIIKRAVGGDESTCLIATGTGATGAIQKLQEILGVYLPPATRDFLQKESARGLRDRGVDPAELADSLHRRRPVVFIGPYEHHSNEIPWRESLAEVREIKLTPSGELDLADLEAALADPRYADRLRIGAFSAASNVTGMRTPVYEVARLLHRHRSLACFDFAASAPYVEIDMNRDRESYFDAVVFSPHKFLGGPGACGVLLLNRGIYRSDLPPTFGAGGTVDYVGFEGQDYAADIEVREKAGTPGTLQILRAALALQIKESVGTETIERREREYVTEVMNRLARHPKVEILGHPDPARRIGIVSFNLKDGEKYLHPKLVTRLLNDLFGIQSRAGCSCAGPYGHRLLEIGHELSNRYRDAIGQGWQGIKPGWARVSLHYVMDPAEVDYICRAVEFLAEKGSRFIPLYRFDPETGAWAHKDENEEEVPDLGLFSTAKSGEGERELIDANACRKLYHRYLEEANAVAARLKDEDETVGESVPGIDPKLVYFRVNRIAPR